MSRLTEEMVIARSKQSDLGTIKKLNCWGSELSDVSIIRRMHGVELLALSVNRVSTLADFENCVKLQELYLRKNNIQDINDLVYLQGLPHLRHLWLEENPCVEKAGPNYRQIVLRALPNLQKLDNIDVTADELAEAMQNVSLTEDDSYEDAYAAQQPSRQVSPPPAQSQPVHQGHQPQHDGYHQQTPSQQQPQQPPQQQWRQSSPIRETSLPQAPQRSPELADDNLSDGINDRNSIPTSPLQHNSPNPEYSPAEPKFNRDQHRNSYHQSSYDRSPGSDHEMPPTSFRERRPMAPSMSMHSMKDYYPNDRPTPPFYRHSQTDLTEWDEQQHNEHGRHNGHHGSGTSSNNNNNYPQQHHSNGSASASSQLHRRSGPPEREPPQGGNGFNQSYGRNGSTSNGKDRQHQQQNQQQSQDDWEDGDRLRRDSRPRRPDSRFTDNGSVSNAVINHYAGFHRRPINRSSNLLSATLCLVKELDYSSLEVVEHAVRCRIDELSTD